MSASARACPALTPSSPAPCCPRRPRHPERANCPAGAATLPRDGAERAVMLALRYVAAAAETGDAACFDAAFDDAEAAFGPRDGALLVARAAALVRALRRDDRDDRDGPALRFLPPPCRFLSPGEGRILLMLRLRLSGGLSGGQDGGSDGRWGAPDGLSGAARAALADLAAPIRSFGLGLPLLPPAAVTAVATATPS